MGSSRFSKEIDPVNEAGSRGIRVAVNHRIGEAGTSLCREKKKGKGKEIAMNEIFTRNRLVTCTYTMRSCINLAWRVSFIPSRKQVAVVPRKFVSAVRQSGSLFHILHSVDKLSNELFEGWSRKEREKIRMGRV